jgi:hypothetical protein
MVGAIVKHGYRASYIASLSGCDHGRLVSTDRTVADRKVRMPYRMIYSACNIQPL